MSRKKRRTLILVGVVCLFLCAAIVFGGVFAVRGDWRYRIGKKFKRYPAPDLVVYHPDWESAEVLLEAFLTDSRVNVNGELLLINNSHPIPGFFSPALTEDGGYPMSETALSAFRAMNDTVLTETATRLFVRSAYRSREEQQAEFSNSGGTVAALPGYSEHETGLALDICVSGYGGMNFLKTKAGRYVNDHCGEFGFIIRYPDGKEAETGFSYEPWHIRYVGSVHARVIMDSNLTLESYLELLTPETWFQSGEYYILRTANQSLQLPPDFEVCSASPDNLGYWILTFRMR